MLSVQPYSVSSVRPSGVVFKANKEKQPKDEIKTYTEPFKTHAGLKTGLVFGAVEGGLALLTGGLLFAPIALLCSAGCGALVDSFINKKHNGLAADVDKYGKNEALKMNDRAELTRNENVYYSSNTGLKMGALLGAVVSPITAMVRLRKFSIIAAVAGVITGAIGGAILGKITDYFSNNAAKEHADITVAKQKIMASK